MLRWSVRSYYGGGAVVGSGEFGKCWAWSGHEKMLFGDLSLALDPIPFPQPPFIPFEVNTSTVVGQKLINLLPGSGRSCLQISFLLAEFRSLVLLLIVCNDLGERVKGCCIRLWRLSMALLWGHHPCHSTVDDHLWNWTVRTLSSCMWWYVAVS